MNIRNIWSWTRDNGPVLVMAAVFVLAVVGAVTVFGRWFWYGVCLYGVVWLWRHRAGLMQTRAEDWGKPWLWVGVVYGEIWSWLMPVHVLEQLSLRIWDRECRVCVKKGTCTECGCSMTKALVPWLSCSAGNWGAVVWSRKKYREIREQFPVEVDVRYPVEEQLKKQ